MQSEDDKRTADFMAGLRAAIAAEDAKRKPRKPKRKKVKAKSDSIIKLQEDYLRWRITQPDDCSQPRTAIFSDDGANELTKSIVAHIYCHGGFAGRINSTGTYKAKEGRFIKSGSRDGMADVNACINGKHIQIEVKIGSDKPRQSQLSVQKEVESAGGTYVFVKTFDDYMDKIGEYFND